MANLIRSACLHKYDEVARSVGLNPLAMLRKSGLTNTFPVEQDVKIPVDKFHELIEESARVAGVEDFGLRMATTRRLSIFGILGLVVREEPTILKALEALARHMHLHNEALLLVLEARDSIVTVKIEMDKAADLRQMMELTVGVVYRIMSELIGATWRPLYVCFSHQAPANMATHRKTFNCALKFGHDFNGIVCLAQDLNAPIPTSDPILAQYIRRYLDLPERSRADTNRKVKKIVHALLPTGHCSADTVAQKLGMNRRTLHRHLAFTGETFSGIVQSVRSELATRCIQNARPLCEVADALGFSSLSAFSRWFRTRFGCTVSAYRTATQGDCLYCDEPTCAQSFRHGDIQVQGSPDDTLRRT